ncbi:MAG: type II secretion system F family protein [Lachnospiraceae bacterium]|nr:type II secretion system F family protein [Lachnospiraceae bacterium]
MEEVSNVTPFSMIYLLITFVVFLFLYLRGKQYKGYCEPLSKNDFMLKDVFGVGFAVLDIIKYQYGTAFDRKLRIKLRELYPIDYNDYYLRVYWAQSFTYLVIGFVFSGLLLNALGPIGIFMGVGLGGVLFYYSFKGLDERIEKRHLKISLDMPDFTNKIIILSGAGLTIRDALIKISKEMSISTPLYEALAECVSAIDTGANETQAFMRLTDKCNTPAMRRFSSVILQNIKYGGAEVIRALSDIADEQWNERKNASEKLAMEAETKLLYPMMLMLFAVIIVTITPAVLGMM